MINIRHPLGKFIKAATSLPDEVVLLASIFPTLMFLSWMQLENLPKIAIAIFALLFSFTSLLYNRARALEDGPVQRRTLFCAEKAFRATTIFIFGTLYAFVFFFFLSVNGFPPRKIITEMPHFIPMALGMPAAIAMGLTAIEMKHVLRLINAQTFGILPIRRTLRRLKNKTPG